MEMNFADWIAELCYSKYMTLAKQGKPNEEEWTLLAGIVKVEDWKKDCNVANEMAVDVVALGTGSKCIGESKLSPAGDILNDSHAEVMARRGFLRYLYHQVLTTYCTGSSEVFRCFSGGKCMIKDNVTFHFFTSHVPCGDASIISKIPFCRNDVHSCFKCDTQDSAVFHNKQATGINVFGMTEDLGCNLSEMELQTMGGEGHTVRTPVNSGKRKYCNTEGHEEESGSKCMKVNLSSSGGNTCGSKQSSRLSDQELLAENNSGTVPVSDIYRTGAKCLPFQLLQDPRLPGAEYHVLGAVRTKPGRGVPTQSLSCSDKFARWNVVGLQGALLALLINEPVYFQSLTVGGGGPFSEEALKRAIIDRLIYRNNGGQNWSEGEKVDEAFTVGEGVSLPSKYAVGHPLMLQSTLPFKHARTPDGMRQPCPSSIVWCKVPERALEVAVEGKKQGVTKRAAHTSAGRLLICKKELLRQFVNVVLLMPDAGLHLSSVLNASDVAGNIVEIEQCLVKMPYRHLKYLSEDYKEAWSTVRATCLPSWTVKCQSLLNFSLVE